MPSRCIFFKFLDDTLLGLIQDTMPPQAAILGEFEDHYTQILWPTLNVALTTTRNSNIQLDFSQTPRNTYDCFGNRMMQVISFVTTSALPGCADRSVSLIEYRRTEYDGKLS